MKLGSRGHSVSVLTNRWPAGVSRSEVLEGVPVTRLRFPLPAARPTNVIRFALSAPTAAFRLIRHVRVTRADVVHVIGAGPQSVYLGFVAPFLRARLVFTGQGELTFDAQDVFGRSTSLRVGLRRMLQAADIVTACSAFALRDLQAFGSVRGPAHVVPNGVDPNEFGVSGADNGSSAYILAVGRLVPQKGFDVLLNALTDSRLSDLRLLLAGDGLERERLEREAHRLGLAGRVDFLGAVSREHLGDLLRGATVFAFPSRGEAFGIALLEAMAAGVPAVAAAAGGIPEFARDGENALLVEVDEARPIADAIARICRDEHLRQRIIHGGKNTAAALAWATISERYEEIYMAALETGET